MEHMKRFEMEKIYIKTDAPDPVADILANVMRDAPEVLKIAMVAGCKIETILEGDKLIIRTIHPISILRNLDGRVVSVIEKSSL